VWLPGVLGKKELAHELYFFYKLSVLTTTTSTTTEAGAVAEAAEAAVEDNEVEAGVSRDHWVEVSSFPLGGESSSSLATTVTKYQSQLTGLTVVLARAESPIVNGYFCLATEAMDNDGLPHTLEHLIFLGSEDYPYKEVLDLLANRALADRTNAWTDTDHTCYTVYTAGPSGFLAILPVYLDHILYPTITPEGYITEVHHVTGEGEEGRWGRAGEEHLRRSAFEATQSPTRSGGRCLLGSTPRRS